MTTATLRLYAAAPTHVCPQCRMVNVPADRDLCYGCSKPPTPRVVPQTRLEHVRSHLRVQDQPYLDWLLLPLTFDEIAAELGPGWTRRQVERAWEAIRLSMGIETTGNTRPLGRLALVRIAVSLDPCFCNLVDRPLDV